MAMTSPHVRDRGRTAGFLSTASGALAVVAVVWLALLTYALDAPNWLRILGASFLPIGVVLGLATGVVGRRGPGRAWALNGLTLVAAALVGFAVLIASVDY